MMAETVRSPSEMLEGTLRARASAFSDVMQGRFPHQIK